MNEKRNSALYRQMSEPFENPDLANEAVESFFKALSAAREQFHIADVLCVVAINVCYESGEGEGITYMQIGDTSKTQALAAYAYGQEQGKQREELNRLLSGRKAQQ